MVPVVSGVRHYSTRQQVSVLYTISVLKRNINSGYEVDVLIYVGQNARFDCYSVRWLIADCWSSWRPRSSENHFCSTVGRFFVMARRFSLLPFFYMSRGQRPLLLWLIWKSMVSTFVCRNTNISGVCIAGVNDYSSGSSG